MSEENPFDDIDNILEYISDNIIFDNQIQLDLFLFEFESRLKDLFLNKVESESSTSEESTTESEPKLKVNIDEEGFYSLI